MFTFIEEILSCFRSCFSRKTAFGWFVTIIVGFMVRSNLLGITPVIRNLVLDPALYNSMEHFFRADSWEWEGVFTTCVQAVSRYAPLKQISGRVLLVGDGVKRASDGRYMPCTKKRVQESEDSSKPTFIHGHLWGTVGVLAGNAAKIFCLPLSIQIHDGDGVISGWLGDESVSHVVQILRDSFRAAQHIGQSLFILDRYFLTKPMLLEWKTYSAETPGMLHVITRAKRDCTAYEKPRAYKGRGRRPIRGDAVRLQDLFVSQGRSFQNARLQIYGVGRDVRFLSRTYLWGQDLYQGLQFVFVEYGQTQAILVSTDLSMPAEDIIKAYACRFKIEAMFREMKQQIGGFFYHF